MIFTEQDARTLERIRTTIDETLQTVRQIGRDLDPDLVQGITRYLADLNGEVCSELDQFDTIQESACAFDGDEEIILSAACDVDTLDFF